MVKERRVVESRSQCTNEGESASSLGCQRISWSELSKSEERVVKAMRKRPQMRARIEAILAMSLSGEGQEVKKADEIEAMLIEELRALGANTLREWRAGAEQVAQKHRKENPGSYITKKRPQVVEPLRAR